MPVEEYVNPNEEQSVHYDPTDGEFLESVRKVPESDSEEEAEREEQESQPIKRSLRRYAFQSRFSKEVESRLAVQLRRIDSQLSGLCV